ncbi:MAG: DedA family protein [Actinobacteria bacterium]|nr:DedA family protein [Actinomycetota bacterium]
MEVVGFLNLIFKYFEAYGYYVVFIASLLENIMVIGLFFPGEIILIGASAFAAQNHFKLPYIILNGIIGAIIGNNIGYFIGRKGGRPFIEKFGDRFFISKERILAAEKYFDEHGPKTILIGRFIGGVRVFIAAIAGASRMDYKKFIFYTCLSVIFWTVTASVAGYFFGQNWPFLLKIIRRIGWIVGLIVFMFIVYKYLKTKRSPRDDESEL